MKSFIIATAAFLVLAATARADDTLWVRQYGRGMTDMGLAVATSGTDIYVAAMSQAEFTDILAIKYDAAGETAWVRILDIDTMEMVVDMAVGADGNPVVCAQVEGVEQAASLVKLGQSGDTAWTRHHDGIRPSNLALGGQDAVYIWSSVTQPMPDDSFALLRYQSDGTLDWKKTLWLGTTNHSAGCCADLNGNIVASGTVFDSIGVHPVLVRFGPDGDTLWTRRCDTLGNAEMLGVAADHQGNIIATAWEGQYLDVVKYDSTGGVLWVAQFQAYPTPEDVNNVTTDADGNIFLPVTDNLGRCELLMLGPDGRELWTGHTEIRGGQSAVAVGTDNRPVTVGMTTYGVPECLTIKYTGGAGVGDQGHPGEPERVPGLTGPTILDSNARLSFEVDMAGQYTAKLFDETGSLVREVACGHLEPGTHSCELHGLASGSYTLVISGPGGTLQRKLLRLR